MPKSNYVTRLKQVLEKSLGDDLLAAADGTDGFSGRRLLTLLGELSRCFLRPDESCYVEIGVFRGLTLLTVADHLKKSSENGAPTCYGIDNFSQFDQDGQNKTTVLNGVENLQLSNVKLINHDYEVALAELDEHVGKQKIGVLFVDGPHDYRSQLMCLMLALPHLADDAVIVVDDCNYPHVRLATADFLACHPEFKLAFEGYTPRHPINCSEVEEAEQRAGWWNGVHVIVRDKDNCLEILSPPCGDARAVCENEHVVQSDRLSRVLPATLPMLRAMVGEGACGKLVDGFGFVARFLRKIPGCRLISEVIYLRKACRGRLADFPTGNTFSGDLTVGRMNPSLKS